MIWNRTLRQLRISFALFLVLLPAIWLGPFLFALAKPLFHTSNSVPLVSISTTEKVITPQADNRFYYPNLGISAEAIKSPETDPITYSDWGKIRQSLQRGVSVTFSGENFASARIAYFLGHSSDYYPHPYAYIFAGLGQANVGETFYINLDGQTFMYQVTEKKVIDPYDVESFRSLEPESASIQRAVLVTCWPVFTTQKRLVVVGERDINSSEAPPSI